MDDGRARARTHRWHAVEAPLEAMKRLSGLEYMRQTFGAAANLPPIATLMGMRGAAFEPGRAVFEADPAEFHYNPIGTVHGGFAATLLDSAMSCAVHTTCAPGVGYTTVEIKVNYVRPITEGTGTVTAEGRTIAVGSRIATAEGRITDRDGKVLAHGTATCLFLPL
jgi:uncharacterized protein (TIGR00369 family)